MKISQAPLLVGLGGKMARVARHWAVVDDVLPPEFPLVLLSDVGRAAFGALIGRLPRLRDAVTSAELNLKLARVAYERRKGEVHRTLRSINVWMRAYYRGTPCFAAVWRVPGRGQSYEHWWHAATRAVGMWKQVLADPPVPLPDSWEWPLALGPDGRVEQLEELVKTFNAAYWAIVPAELALKLARVALAQAQAEATDLLMAFGHGVRARLGHRGELVRGIPQLWPKHSTAPRGENGAGDQRVVVRRRKAR